ncbi:ABC transporter ATP-binding protein [Embleya sp. NBC_00896]|uniref:ABC transporter ATP-binding protein n=1 Tax=Embleya sp. NBC_00896 TaxID=2975961 RepID=UPI003870934A|nr:ABC transporter ATP-binding protein [Embleya sp. NBC_00896]
MIEVKGLTKRYDEKVAVDDLSFTVQPGRVTGFLGPNGAGKTTTMRMILGLDAPTSGVATVSGRRYVDLPRPMRAVGALLDAKAAHPGRTARSHLVCLARSNGLPARRAGEVLERVGLEEVAGKRVGQFSLGMSQRLGIAAALLGDPGILMFDEPVNGLDPEGIRWIRQLMKRLAEEGRTVLVSSHLMSEMALTADHLIVIGRGRLVADTGLEEFIEQSSTRTVLVRTPFADYFARVLTASGAKVLIDDTGALVVSNMDSLEIGRRAAADGVQLAELTPQRTSLEEAFMELTRDSVEYNVTEGAVR